MKSESQLKVDLNSKIAYKFNLPTISKHERIPSCSQKCRIPSEKFPAGVIPGSLGICTLQTDQQYLCYIYPSDNKYPQDFCAMDKSVKLKSPCCSAASYNDMLVSIRILSSCIKPFPKLSAKIILNRAIFQNTEDMSRTKLTDIVRIFLSVYTFTPNSIIETSDEAKQFGIETIHLISEVSADADDIFAGKIDDDTEFTLDDIQFVGSATPIYFQTIAGVDCTVDALNRIIREHRMWHHPPRHQELKPSLNTLIIGAIGCGKTTICRNSIVANNLNCFEIQSSDLISSLPGETEKKLRRLFSDVKNFIRIFQPKEITVILIENIELICPVETNISDKSHVSRISGQLMSLLDDLHSTGTRILILGTTSNLEQVNLALRRPGRFENELMLHSLTEKNRYEILTLLLRKEIELNVEDADRLARWASVHTAGYVAADLVLLVNSVSRQKLQTQHGDDLPERCKAFLTDVLKSIKPTSLRGTDILAISSQLTFNDIGGMDALKKSLSVSILLPLRNPEAFRRFNIEPPKGILLYGPPGCAKTMIAKCLANESKMTLISTSGAEVYSPYVGNAEKFILKIFNTARKNAPCLIFFDEIDALVGNRKLGASSDVQIRVLSALLTEIDGIGVKIQSATNSSANRVLIVGATNRPDIIDNALIRPGRFDRLIHVPAPDNISRLKILNIFRDKMPFAKTVDLDGIVKRTENFSGADLCNLCNEAGLAAMTRNFNTMEITMDDFFTVLDKMKPSLTIKQLEWYRNFEMQHSFI